MYIKQITIFGFKSYKDLSNNIDFHPGNNIIVGRNGSGKSNFFSAIRFVLNDSYQALSPSERQSLLHEGTSEPTLTAFVEIVFDNTENRFPTGKSDTIIRRTIEIKKDEYTIDKKVTSKTELLNFLEAAGFSKSNPYYIVPQGRISTLTHAKDSERLEILKEVAGTKIYENRRIESVKLIQDTEKKQKKISDLMKHIQSKMKDLEAEKIELKKYQIVDCERKCIESAIYTIENNELKEALNNLNEFNLELTTNSNEVRDQIKEEHKKLEEKKKQHEDRAQLLKQLEYDIKQKYQDLNSASKQKAKLNSKITEYSQELVSADGTHMTMDFLKNNIQEIQAQISKQEKAVTKQSKQYETQCNESATLVKQINELKADLNTLLLKKNQTTTFSSIDERNSWIHGQIEQLQNNLNLNKSQLELLKNEKQSIEKDIIASKDKIKDLELPTDDKIVEKDELEKKISSLHENKDNLVNHRRTLSKQNAKLDAKLSVLNAEKQKVERSISSFIDKNTWNGLQELPNICKKLGLEIGVNVHGPLYKLFRTQNDGFDTVIETIASNCLYYVVVDNELTASLIIKEMLRTSKGRITFIPLNKIKRKTPLDISLVETVEADEECVFLIDQITYNNEYENVCQYVFGNTLVCSSLQAGSAYSNENLTIISIDGDRIDKYGAMIGGYIDMDRSKLKNINHYQDIKEQIDTIMIEKDDTKAHLLDTDSKINHIISQLTILNSQKKSHDTKKSQILEDASSKMDELNDSEAVLYRKTKSISNIEIQIEDINNQLVHLREELNSEFDYKDLDSHDENMKSINSRIEKLTEELTKITKFINEGELSIISSRHEIKTFKSKKLELLKKIDYIIRNTKGSASLSYNVDILTSAKEKMKEIDTQINEYKNIIKAARPELDKLRETSNALLEEIEYLNEHLGSLDSKLHSINKKIEKIFLQQSQTEEKIKDTSSMINKLGVLPESLCEKFKAENKESLMKKLSKTNTEISKKYQNVNHKALDQYQNFSNQHSTLVGRKKELESSGKSIKEFITMLDYKKDEAIQRSFKQVAKNFSSIFERLVPQGKGDLVMLRQTDQANDIASTHETSALSNYIGISIKVSFASKTGDGTKVQQLSGGQKSLVALALIFAIQQCDPAPFYLFDEIDANLDPDHRSSVANMIKEFSKSAQFISTTFKPEMIEHADEFYGVSFTEKVSVIQRISKSDAVEFIAK